MITFTNLRSIKISSVFIKNRWSSTVKPKLTLSGNWLADAGFDIGERVIIEVQDKKLVIRKAENAVYR